MADRHSKPDSIASKDDLENFIRHLANDAVANPDDWENRDLASYLEAMAAWVGDMDGFYANVGRKPPSSDPQLWRTVAEILYAAKMYE